MSKVGLLESAAVSRSWGNVNTGSIGESTIRNVHGSFRFAHPFSPYALNLNRRIDLLSELASGGCLVDTGIISSKASQTSRPSRSFAVLKVVIIEAIFSVVDGGRTTFRQSRRRRQLGLRNDRCDEGVSERAQSRGIAANKRLWRINPPF